MIEKINKPIQLPTKVFAKAGLVKETSAIWQASAAVRARRYIFGLNL